MRQLGRLILLGLLGLTVLPAKAAAEEPDRMLRFADSLLLGGEQYRAITEYLRFASYFPEDPRAEEMPLRIGLAYLYGGRPEQAIAAVAPALGSSRPELREKAAYLQGRSTAAAGETELFVSGWKEPGDAALARLGRQRLLQARLRLGHWQEAVEMLREANHAGLDAALAASLEGRLQGGPPPRRRSPVLASVLSGLLPGAGQLYAGRKRDALVSLLVNGLFVLGAVQAFRGGNEATGILLSSAEIGWYSGNVLSAASAVRSRNQRELDRYLREVADLPTLEAQSSAGEAELLLGVKIAF